MFQLSKVSCAVAASAVLALTFGISASAQVQVSPDLVKGGSLWSVTAFDDSSPAHTQLATQSICFEFTGIVGTQLRYRWRSTTFPDWNGIASQEGDQIFMHGDYARDIGHDGMNWSIDTSKSGSGHWVEWRENGAFGNTIAFANATFQRTGNCPIIRELPSVPLQYFSNGALVETPLGLAIPKEQE